MVHSLHLLGSKRFATIACCSVLVTTGLVLYLVSLFILASQVQLRNDIQSYSPSVKPITSGLAICTIASRNYIGRVRTFFASLSAYPQNATNFLLLVDSNEGYIQPQQESFLLLELEQLHIPELQQMLLRYNQMEANTAFKAALLHYVFMMLGFQKVIYFDPDIWVTASIEPLWTLLDYYSILLTPHIVEPFPDDEYHPNDLDLLRAGTMNLGFIALKNTKPVCQLLLWWHHAMVSGAYVDIDHGYHFDQHWMDLATSFISDIYILREKQYNIAYWNLHERGALISLDKSGTCCLLLEPSHVPSRVVFFHFSGLQLDNVNSISKHSQRFKLSEHFPQLVPIYEQYARFYASMIPKGSLSIPYAYDSAQDGTPIHFLNRQLYRELYSKIPSSADPFSEILRLGRERVHPHTRIPRLLHLLWRTRGDVQALFPDPLGRDSDRFLHWVEQFGRKELKLSDRTLPRVDSR